VATSTPTPRSRPDPAPAAVRRSLGRRTASLAVDRWSGSREPSRMPRRPPRSMNRQMRVPAKLATQTTESVAPRHARESGHRGPPTGARPGTPAVAGVTTRRRNRCAGFAPNPRSASPTRHRSTPPRPAPNLSGFFPPHRPDGGGCFLTLWICLTALFGTQLAVVRVKRTLTRSRKVRP
jgi:hypothetical protein